VIAAELGAAVEQRDDQSQDSMYDLRITYPSGSVAAAEVVAAADADSIELWKLVNNSDAVWVEPGLQGGWFAWLRPTARADRLRERLPTLLRDLEGRGASEVIAHQNGWTAGDLDEQLVDDLGIDSLRQHDTSVPGSIYLSIQQPTERIGGLRLRVRIGAAGLDRAVPQRRRHSRRARQARPLRLHRKTRIRVAPGLQHRALRRDRTPVTGPRRGSARVASTPA